MSTLQIAERISHPPRSAAAVFRAAAETACALFAFALFIVLGPFAAIAVVPAVIGLIPGEGDMPDPQDDGD